jgi:hypothetical protein
MFIIIIIIIIIIRNGAKTISLQTSFGDLIRNRANTICLLKLRLGDIIRNGANTTRYGQRDFHKTWHIY